MKEHLLSANLVIRKQREAAIELEHLFERAKEDGVTLLGVSAYRSYQTQKAHFERYVAKDGYEKARTYSAVPGTSEHQTGLSIDVTGEMANVLLNLALQERRKLLDRAACC